MKFIYAQLDDNLLILSCNFQKLLKYMLDILKLGSAVQQCLFVTHSNILSDSCSQIKALLGDYDAIHVRRGDKIKTRKDRFGVVRSLHPHLDRDTRPEFMLCRIAKWVPPGRTLFIASNERTPGFFSPLSAR